MHKPKLIITDDDPIVINFLKEVTEISGYEVSATTSARQLLDAVREACPDIIILDLVMPDMDGIEALKELAKKECSSAIILITGYQKDYLETAKILGTAHGLNIIGSLYKPFQLDELNELLQSAYPSQ